jgi:hypothetical protein
MAEYKKKRRHGPPPKPAEEVRTNRVSVYFTDAELADLDGRCAGVGRGAWLRRSGLGQFLRLPVPAINREAWAELARCAGNLNQAMKAVNEGRIRELDPAVVEELLDQVQGLRRDLVKGPTPAEPVEEATDEGRD